MQITGNTRVFLILGDPVAQLRAPEVFNHLFRKHGADAVLVPAQVPVADFAGFARTVLRAGNIDGLWLAVPHKLGMVALLDQIDLVGRVAGTVNAARRNADGSLEGALFDGVGFVRALRHFGLRPAGRRVLVVGVGSSGVAIAAALAQQGVGCVSLFDACPGRAAEVAARLRHAFDAEVHALASADPAGQDLVVNATPLGLRPSDPLPFDVARLDPGCCVVDILTSKCGSATLLDPHGGRPASAGLGAHMKYRPTPLLRACQARGLVAHPGHEMLVQQIPEYLSFFGYDDIARKVQADASDVRKLLAPSAAELA